MTPVDFSPRWDAVPRTFVKSRLLGLVRHHLLSQADRLENGAPWTDSARFLLHAIWFAVGAACRETEGAPVSLFRKLAAGMMWDWTPGASEILEGLRRIDTPALEQRPGLVSVKIPVDDLLDPCSRVVREIRERERVRRQPHFAFCHFAMLYLALRDPNAVGLLRGIERAFHHGEISIYEPPDRLPLALKPYLDSGVRVRTEDLRAIAARSSLVTVEDASRFRMPDVFRINFEVLYTSSSGDESWTRPWIASRETGDGGNQG